MPLMLPKRLTALMPIMMMVWIMVKVAMKSHNIITAKRKHITWSMEELSTQLPCHFQITYHKLTNGRHKTPLKIMMANSIYGKTHS